MTLGEFIQWWKALESVEPYSIEPDGIVRKDYPPRYLAKIKPLPGKLVLNESEQADKLFHELWHDGKHPTVLLNLDDDSHLQLSNGNKVHHAGYNNPPPWTDSEQREFETLMQDELRDIQD